jgi:hypothetical protein
MKKLITIFFALIIVGLHANNIAFTLKAQGDVSLTRSEEISPVTNGMELLNEDVIETKEDSFAAVKFIDGSSVVKVFPRSLLTIKATVSEDNKLNKTNYLNSGEMWAKVSRKTGDFEIDTPTTVVSVKGTRLQVSVDEAGATTVNTFSGVVEMTNKVDGKSAMIAAGENATSTGEGEIEVVKGNSAEEDYQDDSEEKSLRINLQNPDGESKTIIINFE